MIYPELSDSQIGFIGSGNICLAMVKGFIKSGKINASQIFTSAPSDRNLIKFKDLGCHTTHDNYALFGPPNRSKTKIIFLCVKPYVVSDSDIFIDIKEMVKNYGQLIVISVLAGTTIETIREKCNAFETTVNYEFIRFARLIPNTACSIGSGICGLSLEEEDQEFYSFLTTLLSLIGFCQRVPEQQLNAVCGLGGSGIAFVYSLIQAMSDGGLKMGLSRTVATSIAAQTVLGAASMVLQTDRNPIELRNEVTSPAGTTIHGLHVLEKGSFNSVIMDAIETATKRAIELSEK